jgi:putative ABC transport system permease protein
MNRLTPQLKAWWLLGLATLITITIVAASQLFTQRISKLLDQQASELLAADMLISSSEILPSDYLEMAHQQGLNTARTVALRTAIFIDDDAQLVELKAVSAGYPLRGVLERKKHLFAEPDKVARGPAVGEIWIDSKLAAQLGHKIDIGMTTLPARWILSYEPDRGGSLFNLAPRIMMNLDDLPATELLVPGSRARYSLLLAGDADALQRFQDIITPRLKDGEQLQTLHNARPEMRNALDRTRSFFAFSIVLTLVIAMIAIAITARYLASQEAIKVAVMRSFGISGRRLLGYYLAQLFKVWLWAMPVGLLLGYLAQFPLQWALGAWFGTRLPQTGASAFALAALVGLISLLGFSLPHLLNVLDSSPMQVLRQMHRRRSSAKSLWMSGFSLLTLFVVLLLIVQQLKITAMLFGVVLLIAGVIPLFLKLLLKLLLMFTRGRFWISHYVLTRLASSPRNALFVMTGFSLTLLSVLLISLVKDQLLQDWETQLPQDKPNYFLINIPTRQAQPLNEFLQANAVQTSTPYALVRTRLTRINGREVKDIDFSGERAERLINHVFNLSYSSRLPPDNAIVEGAWTPQQGFSVETGMAHDLGLKLGDRLQFTISGELFEDEISSIRSVMWENFRPNFYILAPQKLLEDKPQTWLLSAFIDDAQRGVLKPLLQQFPTVTLLDISELMGRIKGIIHSASLALEFFFLFAGLCAILVLLSALKTTSQQRETEIALLQALGANRRQKLFSQVLEFLLMGLLVGSFAALFANAVGVVIGRWLFDLSFGFAPALWLIAVLTSSVVITLAGVIFIVRSFSTSPMRLLRS